MPIAPPLILSPDAPNAAQLSPLRKKAFPLPSPDITSPGVDSAWGADISETCLDGQPSAIPARPSIVLLIRIMSTRNQVHDAPSTESAIRHASTYPDREHRC
ncbi:hypothetical protein CGCF413_v002430 [Colletotrichum fructicola]|nr:hypothetical protein CGCF413_v002430 [Colletotrichum fructicola]